MLQVCLSRHSTAALCYFPGFSNSHYRYGIGSGQTLASPTSGQNVVLTVKRKVFLGSRSM